jgi:nucleoside-diphosphate-sugar epimerase
VAAARGGGGSRRRRLAVAAARGGGGSRRRRLAGGGSRRCLAAAARGGGSGSQQRGRRGETYLLGHGDLDFAELAQLVQTVAGVRRPIVFAPFGLARLAGHAARFVADHVTHRPPWFTAEAVAIARLGLAADPSEAVRELGLPQTPIEQSVRDALAWFTKRGLVRPGPSPRPRPRPGAEPVDCDRT